MVVHRDQVDEVPRVGPLPVYLAVRSHRDRHPTPTGGVRQTRHLSAPDTKGLLPDQPPVWDVEGLTQPVAPRLVVTDGRPAVSAVLPEVQVPLQSRRDKVVGQTE